MTRLSPVLRYRQVELASRTEGATPHTLVAMLYDELAVALGVMARAVAGGDTALRLRHHERASSILHALEAGLDPVGGGELAVSLGAIYRQMRQRLLAGRLGDEIAVNEVRNGLQSLAGAWAKLAS
jgi:flagellar secretion chaperone FliS